MQTRTIKKHPDDFMQTVEFGVEELPEIKNWEVGGSYKLVIEVEQIVKKQGDDLLDDERELCARFKIKSVGVVGEESFEQEYARKFNKANKK